LFDAFRCPAARPQFLERGGPHTLGHVAMVSA
jgi:hypothetical protein